MNDINNKNEIIEINDQEKNIDKNINNFIIAPDKYNLDYTSEFNSLNNILKSIPKQKLLIQLFLNSSKLNMFNKIILLDRLYEIIDSEKNFDMMYYITSKLIKYIKTGRISIYMMNTNLFFCSEFLSNNQNFFFDYKFFSDLKQFNNNITLDKRVVEEINEFIQEKNNYFEKYFLHIMNHEKFCVLNDIINNILNQDKNENKKEENNENINNKNDNINDQYIYLINKAWLENAKIFLGNYFFAKESEMLNEFFKDAFDLGNILSVFLSEDKINKPIGNKTYYPFPGPINNFPITEWKNILYDPLNVEENILLKKYLLPKKDYFWINHKEWATLKENFTCTNEIKRKKEECDMIHMIQISAFIFDSRIRKYKNDSINLLNKKIIQISKNKTIKDFETKIIRCLDYEINKILKNDVNEENKNEINVYLYKINKSNKDIITQIILSFINDIQTYESIYLQELIFNEEEKNNSVENIFKKYNTKTEILIIEIHQKINSKFLKQILPKLNQNQKYIYYCSICNKEINDINTEKNICPLCNMYIFCSNDCSKLLKDNKEHNKITEHLKLHNILSEIILKPFKLKKFFSESFDEKINRIENKEKSKGRVGLFNLGNTCYMNCSLQCLSNTKDLTKYFINNYFQNEINLQTTFGSNGVLVKSYFDLINLMWFSRFKKINPYFFRISFCVSTNKFMNNNQQDAMEFISFLLNCLHEDLNRIKQKPYLILEPQKENESDILASQRYFSKNLKRDNSIIIDLFNGQFQNIIKCTSCLAENKTYEPFNNISLLIPEEHNFYIIKFFTNLNCKYITININSETTFEDLILKASVYLNKNILKAIEEIKKSKKEDKNYIKALLEKNIEIVRLDKNKIIKIIYSQPDNENDIPKNYKKKLKEYINSEEELVLFEREIIPDYLQNIYVYPITIDINDEDNINFLSYPVVFSVKHDLTLEQLEKLIMEKLNHILIDNLNIKNSHLIDLHILHSNKNMNTGFFNKLIKEYPKCRFCGSDYSEKKYCPLYFYFNKNDTISKLFQFSKYSEPLIILARSSYYDFKKEVYPGYNFEENNILNKYKNIYDSLNQFGKQEILGEDNLWDCPKCLTKRKIYKSIKIFRAPNYLIIQLKRFKKKSNGFFSFLESDKNDSFVSFPMKNLDLSNYIEGPEKLKGIYNLYAVINHKSTFGFNHFTAFCRNNKQWIEYDDDKINYDVKNPVTREAYILFYIKKNIDDNY